MKSLLQSARFLALDMASTLVYLAVYLVTKSIPIAVGAGVALGVAQVGWEIARKRPIETMQWMSLFLVVASGTAALLTNDARFVLYKASVIYAIIGVVMLKPGWMNRYLPAVAIEIVPDVAYIFGFVWSALMFVSAVVNLWVATHYSFAVWTGFMSAYALVSKLGLFLIQYGAMRTIAIRRRRVELAAVPVAA
jgi:intracellular septation protein A